MDIRSAKLVSGSEKSLTKRQFAISNMSIQRPSRPTPPESPATWKLSVLPMKSRFEWENGRYSAVGRRVEAPFMNMKYRSTHGPLFETGPRPPNTPYIRGFES